MGLGLLILRVVMGTLLAGHGAQKLFGWFGCPAPTRQAPPAGPAQSPPGS
jgi:uncharacterized membrane protein YphA (DoxX/SURF4 family)